MKKTTIKKKIRFQSSPYRFIYIWKNIKWYYYEVKNAIHRMFYGYDDSDTGNIDNWFLDIVPNMLQRLRDSHWGHPCNMTEEEWEKILDDMIFYFKESDERTCSKQEKDFDWKPHSELEAMTKEEQIQYNINRSNWYEDCMKIGKYRDEMKDKGFELFAKYFWNLWD